MENGYLILDDQPFGGAPRIKAKARNHQGRGPHGSRSHDFKPNLFLLEEVENIYKDTKTSLPTGGGDMLSPNRMMEIFTCEFYRCVTRAIYKLW